MVLFLPVCVVLGILPCLVAALDPDTYANVSTIIRSKGYTCEEHDIQTADGFLLDAQRIPKSLSGAPATKGPVFLQPGLVCSTGVFVLNWLNGSLPYYLADRGFDVWLVNSRNRPLALNRNVHIPVTSPLDWEWSWDEMAKFDVPAAVKYILKVTGLPHITGFIGHSQGGTIGWAAFSSNHELASRVRTFVSLAGPASPPSSFHVDGLHVLNRVAPVDPPLSDAELHPAKPVRRLPQKKLQPLTKRPDTSLWSPIGLVCDRCGNDSAPWPGCCKGLLGINPGSPVTINLCKEVAGLCYDILCEVVGCQGTSYWNESRATVLAGHYPAMTSIQNFDHWGQVDMDTPGGFKHYDYGNATINKQHYGTDKAPEYNVSSINMRVAMFSGTKDKFVGFAGQSLLRRAVAQSLVSFTTLPYGHLDFIFSLDAPTLLYPGIVEALEG